MLRVSCALVQPGLSVPRAAPNKQKLTPLTVAKLRPQARAFLVWDSLQRGLVLQVQPSGYPSFKVIYRHHNKPRWYHLGAADAIALADARRMAAELMLEVIRGKDPIAERRAERGTQTFAALASRYLEEYAKKRNKSWQQAANLVRRHLLPAWGDLSANVITRSDVRAVIGKINAPVLANQVLASASAIFTWATKQELLTNNPARGIERNATVSRERVLSDAEVPLFWQAFSEAGLPGMVLKVLLLTGRRPGEVSHMRHKHIADGWWELLGAPEAATGWPGTKNAQTHRVWLPQAVRDIIAELNVDDDRAGFVFGQVWALDATMRDVCKRLKVSRATPHDLRRTHGSTITALGFGRDAMNRIQNHREGSIASVYDRHGYAEENRRIMESVAAKLLSLVERAPSNNVITFNGLQR
jgi:integrase